MQKTISINPYFAWYFTGTQPLPFIIAVVVVIPGLQGFAGDILDNLTNWWNSMAANVFATP